MSSSAFQMGRASLIQRSEASFLALIDAQCEAWLLSDESALTDQAILASIQRSVCDYYRLNLSRKVDRLD